MTDVIKEDTIIENLKQVYDPEISINIYDLGLIYNIEIDQLTRGLVKWENGKVEVETTGLKGTPRIKGAQITKIN